MRAPQQSASYAEFISEAQRFLASDDEESLSSDADNDIPPTLHPSSCSDGNGSESIARRHEIKEDRAWAVAFAVNFVVTVISALHFHGTAFTVLSRAMKSRGWSLISIDSGGTSTFVMCLAIISLAHAALASMVNTLASGSKRIIQVVFVVMVILSFAVVCFLWRFGDILDAAVFAGIFFIIVHLFYSRRGRINFAAANLKVAALVIKATPQVSSWTFFMIGIRIAWLFVVSVAGVGSVVAFQTVRTVGGAAFRAIDCHSASPQMTASRSCECAGIVISDNVGCSFSEPNVALVSFWIMSAMWGSALTAQVVAATMAESVASWWSSPGCVEPLWKSFHRVIHESPGEAVLVGVSRPVHFVVVLVSHMVRVVRLPLVYMQRVERYVLEFAVYRSSLYRGNDNEAARRFRTLLSTNGLANFHTEALVVVSVGSAFLHIAVYAILAWGITGQGPSSLTQTSLLHPSLAIVYGSTAVTIGTTVEVVLCAFRTVFAFFVQDPEAFAASHDHWLQGGMYRSWKQLQLNTTGEAHAGAHA